MKSQIVITGDVLLELLFRIPVQKIKPSTILTITDDGTHQKIFVQQTATDEPVLAAYTSKYIQQASTTPG